MNVKHLLERFYREKLTKLRSSKFKKFASRSVFGELTQISWNLKLLVAT